MNDNKTPQTHEESPEQKKSDWEDARLAWHRCLQRYRDYPTVRQFNMKYRPCSDVLQQSGRYCKRTTETKVCAVCGEAFLGRKEAKACDAECTTKLRSLSARNRRKPEVL